MFQVGEASEGQIHLIKMQSRPGLVLVTKLVWWSNFTLTQHPSVDLKWSEIMDKLKDKWLSSPSHQLKFRVTLARSEAPTLFVMGTATCEWIFLVKATNCLLLLTTGLSVLWQEAKCP